MKKNYITSYLLGAIVFFGCVSCVFGGDKTEKEYVVTINGIEIYNSAAIGLLRSIIREEKEAINIVDQGTGKNLGVTAEILKPETNILIIDSKIMANVSELFEIFKERRKKSPDECNYYSGPVKDKNVLLMKIGNQFCISDKISYTTNEILLCINDNNQIIKFEFLYPRSTDPNSVQNAEPMHE